jgi:hypothetical protein
MGMNGSVNIDRTGNADARLLFDTVYEDQRDQEPFGPATIGLLLQWEQEAPDSFEMSIIRSDLSQHVAAWQTLEWHNMLITLVDLQPIAGGPQMDQDEYEATFQVIGNPFGVDVQSPVYYTEMSDDDLWGASFDLDSASAAGDSLNIGIAHGGGCRTHYFVAFARPVAKIGYKNSEYNIFLRHYNNGDFCRGWFEKELSFDLHQLRDRSTSSVTLHVRPYPNVPYPDTAITVTWNQLVVPVD